MEGCSLVPKHLIEREIKFANNFAKRITRARALPRILEMHGIDTRNMNLDGAIQVHEAMVKKDIKRSILAKRIQNHQEFLSLSFEIALSGVKQDELRALIAERMIQKTDIFVRIKEYVVDDKGMCQVTKNVWLKDGYEDYESQWKNPTPLTGNIAKALNEKRVVLIERDERNPYPYLLLPIGGNGVLKLDSRPSDKKEEIFEVAKDFQFLLEIIRGAAIIKALKSTIEYSLDAIAKENINMVYEILIEHGLHEGLGPYPALIYEYSEEGRIREIMSSGNVPKLFNYKEWGEPKDAFLEAIETLSIKTVDEEVPYIILPLKTKETLSGIMVIFRRSKDDLINPMDILLLETLSSLGGMALRLLASERTLLNDLSAFRHDVGASIVTVRGFSSLLLDKITELKIKLENDPNMDLKTELANFLSSAKNFIERIDNAGKAAGDKITEQKERFSAETQKKKVIHDFDILIGNLCKKVKDDIMPFFVGKNIDISFTFSGKKLPVLINPKAFYDIIFYELIRNSAKYSFSTNVKISIEISYDELTESVRLVVKDDGFGIHPEDLPHIFEAGYRAKYHHPKQLESGDPGGTGNGLNIMRERINHDFQGTIIAKSEGLGKGTTFIVSIPIYKEKNNTH